MEFYIIGYLIIGLIIASIDTLLINKMYYNSNNSTAEYISIIVLWPLFTLASLASIIFMWVQK